jgi:hypothetical protein
LYSRPWPIVILAFLHILVKPIVSIFTNARLIDVGPIAYLGSLFESGDWLGLFYVLGLPIIMGCSIYAMKKWSYIVFVVCSCGILFQNMFAILEITLDPVWMILLSLGNIGLVGYFLIPAVRAPYLDAKLRWWEGTRRYFVHLNGRIESPLDALASPDSKGEGAKESISCQVLDISLGGVFASIAPGTLLTEGQLIQVHFSPNNRDWVSFRSKVVFSRPLSSEVQGAQGYGFQFINTTAATQAVIREVIRNLMLAGCPSRDPGLTAWQDFRAWGETLLSTGKGLLPQKARPRARVQAALPPQSELK